MQSAFFLYLMHTFVMEAAVGSDEDTVINLKENGDFYSDADKYWKVCRIYYMCISALAIILS